MYIYIIYRYNTYTNTCTYTYTTVSISIRTSLWNYFFPSDGRSISRAPPSAFRPSTYLHVRQASGRRGHGSRPSSPLSRAGMVSLSMLWLEAYDEGRTSWFKIARTLGRRFSPHLGEPAPLGTVLETSGSSSVLALVLLWLLLLNYCMGVCFIVKNVDVIISYIIIITFFYFSLVTDVS